MHGKLTYNTEYPHALPSIKREGIRERIFFQFRMWNKGMAQKVGRQDHDGLYNYTPHILSESSKSMTQAIYCRTIVMTTTVDQWQ